MDEEQTGTTAPQASLDPFRKARSEDGLLRCPFQGENIPMLLRHADVRAAAKDWKTYSSHAPFRVPIPSEEDVRSMRQLPLEADPPDHTEFRAIVAPAFQRPKTPEFIAKVQDLISGFISDALRRDAIEIVNEFSLPIQSHALTYLLGVPESEADIYKAWGIHVFKVDGMLAKKGTALEDYQTAQLDRAEANPGDDFFSMLTQAEFRGRKLTREEMMGFANIAFAGGRDTIIHSISSIIAYFGEHPEGLEFLREDPKRITHASEEFFRVFMPLTHLGRVCPEATDVHGVPVKANGLVSLVWASANFDEKVFDCPEEIRLHRKPNPHIAFGFGAHLCLGAPHARLIVRTLLQCLIDQVDHISVINKEPLIEKEATYQRASGYNSLTVRLAPRSE